MSKNISFSFIVKFKGDDYRIHVAMLRFRESTAHWFWMSNLQLIRLGCLILNFNLFICKIKVMIITFGEAEIDKYFLILNHVSEFLQLIF